MPRLVEPNCAPVLDRRDVYKRQALERRFQPVQVDEPTVEDTISILRGLTERYEVFHGVKISDNALIAAATLSDRYITDRFLPDKADVYKRQATGRPATWVGICSMARPRQVVLPPKP